MKTTLIEGINKIIESKDLSKLDFLPLLESLLKKTISAISEELEMKPLNKKRKITICDIPEEFGVSYSAKRTDDEICIGQWVFESRKTTMLQHLIFFIVKESFMHFMKLPLTEVIETFVNFIVILWIQKYFGIGYIENPLIVTINRNIYPEVIAGRDYYFYAYLLELMFKKNLDFVIVFNKINEILKQNNQDSSVIQHFSAWVYRSTIKDDDVIAPIYVKKHQEPLIDYYVTQGYENSNTIDLAKSLNKHESTILKAVRRISSNYFFFWNAKINYERIKLHNYFLIIKLGENENITQLQ
ncbi:MAG: hypothetical protein FK733_15455, partial [Asgard group archaeon]|nr:hypothetical protein [Asgard group archaeon]